ncbi:MAG TPA: hypothetical protein VFR97_11525 [Capillimicrobium sp.]|nr:hypothetical protein [Capillimicrobium sp.]
MRPLRWRRPPSPQRQISRGDALRGAATGAAAGIVGALAMTAAARLEQRVTRRPDSYMPAHTLARLLGRPRPDADVAARNVAMHYGTGAVAGMLRGVMAAAGLRGPWASSMHAVVRLTIDQTLENATGAGAPPWTWPRDELLVDLTAKTVYAFATGAVADAAIRRPALG